MTWSWRQAAGRLERDGKTVAMGYSGHGEGLNNPEMEAAAGVGPIPRGRWRIGPAERHPRLGPVAMPLTPDGHDAHGRTAFFIHGDNSRGDQSASHGCIILPRSVRQEIAAGDDRELEVLA